jgi:hypothetical protein
MKWAHPLLPEPVLLSGHDGDDVRHYQERNVREAIHEVDEIKRRLSPS